MDIRLESSQMEWFLLLYFFLYNVFYTFKRSPHFNLTLTIEYRRDLEAKLGPLSREIVECQVTSKAGLDALYSKFVTTVVLR